jgi:hypothetical protein
VTSFGSEEEAEKLQASSFDPVLRVFPFFVCCISRETEDGSGVSRVAIGCDLNAVLEVYFSGAQAGITESRDDQQHDLLIVGYIMIYINHE